MNTKCKHGKTVEFGNQICCKCQYGENSHVDYVEKQRDLVHDINIPYNYKLLEGFNLLNDEGE